MSTTPNKRPHKATVYRDQGGKRWRYRVVAGNHRNVDAPEQSFRSAAYTVKRVQKRWPDAIITVMPVEPPADAAGRPA